MTVEQAQKLIEEGKINGFSIGERVYAKRDTYVVRDDGQIAKRIDKGVHLLAKTFSRTCFGFELENAHWTGNKKSFGTFPDGKVVLATF